MMRPKPSEISSTKREKYVLDKAKKFLEECNYLPSEKVDRERILYYINERNKYLGTDLQLVWTTSPSSLELTLGLSIGKALGATLWSTLESYLKLSPRASLEEAHDSMLILPQGSELGSAVWSALGPSIRAALESTLKSSLERSKKSSIEASLGSDIGTKLKSSLNSSLKKSLGSELESSLKSSLVLSLWSSLGSPLEISLKSSLEEELESSLWSSIESSLRTSLETSLGSALQAELKSSLETTLKTFLQSGYGLSLESSLCSKIESVLTSLLQSSLNFSFMSFSGFIFWDIFYRFNEDETVKNFAKFLPEAYKEAGLGFAVITEKEFYALGMPKYYLNDQNRLHRDYGPAIIWEDGAREYYLNGVRMPEEVVMLKPEEIDPTLLLREQNSSVRREIIRKVECSRILQKLNAKKLDSYMEYELYLIENIDVEPVHILKAECPSTGVFYSLRVPPTIFKARDAINWVNMGIDKDEFLVET